MATIKLKDFSIKSENWKFNNTKETHTDKALFEAPFMGVKKQTVCHPDNILRPADSIVVFDTPSIDHIPAGPELYFLADIQNLDELSKEKNVTNPF